MKQIKCSGNQRIFDIYERSMVNIKMKCGNKRCKHKRTCNKYQTIKCGYPENFEPFDYSPCRCPKCGYRLFDASNDSLGLIQIKCPQCRQIVDIAIGDIENAPLWREIQYTFLPSNRSIAGL